MESIGPPTEYQLLPHQFLEPARKLALQILAGPKLKLLQAHPCHHQILFWIIDLSKLTSMLVISQLNISIDI